MSTVLKAPYPYAGGTSAPLSPASRITRAHTPHIFIVRCSFLYRITCRDGYRYMALFARGLQTIRCASVLIEFGKRLDCFACGTRFFACMRAIPVLVLHIGCMRIPAQIFDSVVGLIRIGVVAARIAWRRGAPERFKHQSVDESGLILSTYVEIHHVVARTVLVSLQLTGCPQSPRTPVIAPFALQRPYGAIGPREVAREARYQSQIFPIHVSILPKPTALVK